MNMRPITESDRKPFEMQPVVGIDQAGNQVGENRFWSPIGNGKGIWMALGASGISMPMLVTHVVLP